MMNALSKEMQYIETERLSSLRGLADVEQWLGLKDDAEIDSYHIQGKIDGVQLALDL
jgi:hypothetical protein